MPCAGQRPLHRLLQEIGPETFVLLRIVHGKASKYRHGDGVWHVSPNLRRCLGMADRPVGQGEVADDPLAAANDKRVRRSGGDRRESSPLQPSI
jgi:hypothetical protein